MLFKLNARFALSFAIGTLILSVLVTPVLAFPDMPILEFPPSDPSEEADVTRTCSGMTQVCPEQS
ncbi:MAG: hypothetical protein ACEPO2_03725 [Pelagibaca sp.]